jgi:Domain of unknown function (DUF4294)
MRFFIRSVISFCLCLMGFGAVAQAPELTPVVIVGDDTIPLFTLPDVLVERTMSSQTRRQAARIDKLTRNVQKVFPYAITTAKLLDQYDHDLAAIERESDKDLYLKLAEAELKAEFETELKNMTQSQGRLLIKLIDRETGHTSYDLVKELRGSFNAWVWQGVAKLFGNNLKDGYDPIDHDVVVESIVKRIENGELACTPRPPRTEKAQARLEKRKARLYKRYSLDPTSRVSN